MDDLTNKLMEILSNKDNMKKIKNLTNTINSSKNTNDNSNPSDKNINKLNKNLNTDDLPADVIQSIIKLMPLLSSINKEDNNTKLLCALRPHLSEKRQNKLDESIKMMKFFKLLPVLKSQKIL